MRTVEDRQRRIEALIHLGMRVGSREVAEDRPESAPLAVQQHRQVRGERCAIGHRDKGCETVLLHETMQRGQVAHLESGWNVHRIKLLVHV